jgi:hypothetical protein
MLELIIISKASINYNDKAINQKDYEEIID